MTDLEHIEFVERAFKHVLEDLTPDRKHVIMKYLELQQEVHELEIETLLKGRRHNNEL